MSGQVERWLGTFMCQRYAETFERFGYQTLDSVCQLGISQLQQMGVAPGHCNVILENVSILRQSLAAGTGKSPDAPPVSEPIAGPASSALKSVAMNASKGGTYDGYPMYIPPNPMPYQSHSMQMPGMMYPFNYPGAPSGHPVYPPNPYRIQPYGSEPHYGAYQEYMNGLQPGHRPSLTPQNPQSVADSIYHMAQTNYNHVPTVKYPNTLVGSPHYPAMVSTPVHSPSPVHRQVQSTQRPDSSSKYPYPSLSVMSPKHRSGASSPVKSPASIHSNHSHHSHHSQHSHNSPGSGNGSSSNPPAPTYKVYPGEATINPLQSLQKLAMLNESSIVNPKSVVNDPTSSPTHSKSECLDGINCGSDLDCEDKKTGTSTITSKSEPANHKSDTDHPVHQNQSESVSNEVPRRARTKAKMLKKQREMLEKLSDQSQTDSSEVAPSNDPLAMVGSPNMSSFTTSSVKESASSENENKKNSLPANDNVPSHETPVISQLKEESSEVLKRDSISISSTTDATLSPVSSSPVNPKKKSKDDKALFKKPSVNRKRKSRGKASTEDEEPSELNFMKTNIISALKTYSKSGLPPPTKYECKKAKETEQLWEKIYQSSNIKELKVTTNVLKNRRNLNKNKKKSKNVKLYTSSAGTDTEYNFIPENVRLCQNTYVKEASEDASSELSTICESMDKQEDSTIELPSPTRDSKLKQEEFPAQHSSKRRDLKLKQEEIPSKHSPISDSKVKQEESSSKHSSPQHSTVKGEENLTLVEEKQEIKEERDEDGHNQEMLTDESTEITRGIENKTGECDNKVIQDIASEMEVETTISEMQHQESPTVPSSSGKKRGRPFGSKNKVNKSKDVDKPPSKKLKKEKKAKKANKFDEDKLTLSGKSNLKLKKDVPKPEKKHSKGPILRLNGQKDAPVSVTLYNDLTEANESVKKKTVDTTTGSVMSDAANAILAKTPIAPSNRMGSGLVQGTEWICALCGKCSNHSILGDLYGPYYTEGTRYVMPGQKSPLAGHKSPLSGQRSPLSGQRSPTSTKVTSPNKLQIPPDKSDGEGNKESEKRKRRRQLSKKASDFLSGDSAEVWLHGDCLVWSNGAYLIGDKIYGLEEVISSAKQTVCSKCNSTGATLCCFQRGCRQKYHFVCAVEKGCQLSDEQFLLFCPKHKNKVTEQSSSQSSLIIDLE